MGIIGYILRFILGNIGLWERKWLLHYISQIVVLAGDKKGTHFGLAH